MRARASRDATLHSRAHVPGDSMEPLWSPVVATVGNYWQIDRPSKPQKQAKSAATGCHRLPATFHGKQGVCRGLPPVAGGPLPAKEGVDAYLARLCAPISSCNPGTGTGCSRSRCMPCGSCGDDTQGFQPRSVCRQLRKRGSAGRGGPGTARFSDADVRRRFLEVEIAAALGPTAQAKEVSARTNRGARSRLQVGVVRSFIV